VSGGSGIEEATTDSASWGEDKDTEY